MTKPRYKSKRKPANKPKAAAPASSPSGKPNTTGTTTLQERAYQGKKRGPKFRASGDDKDIVRVVPVPAQRTDNASRLHTKARDGALRRLAISPAQLQHVPRISHILDHAEGGMPTVIAALRLCDDPEAQKFLDRYDAISNTDHKYLVVEDIAVAADVNVKRLLELAVSALVEDGKSAGAIVAATYHPRVIRKTAEAAMNDQIVYDGMGNPHIISGHADRKLFLTGTGFLPQSNRGSGGVFVNITNQQASANVPVQDGEPVGPQFNAAEDDLRRQHELIDGNRLLEAPKTVESPANMVLGHMYRETNETVEELECIPSKK